MNNRLIIILLCTLFNFYGCKDKDTESKQTINREVVIKDLNYHLANALKEVDNSIWVEQKFNNEVYLRSFAFYENDENHYDLILELQDDITNEIISKYTFAVEGFVIGDELNNLSDYAKKKDRDYDAWYGTPELKIVNDHRYVILDVKTKLKNFDLIKFYLFDKDGYKGDIGERILFYDYKIK